MIFVGIGGNLPCSPYGGPRATCGAALLRLQAYDVSVEKRARWYESAPVPASDQPWFVNSVVQVQTHLDPDALMSVLLQVEQDLGRKRTTQNAARTLDLDIIDYNGAEITGAHVETPHARMHKRAFVLLPLQELAPHWHHPVTGTPISLLTADLPQEQTCRVIEDADGLFGTEWTERRHFDLWGAVENRI